MVNHQLETTLYRRPFAPHQRFYISRGGYKLSLTFSSSCAWRSIALLLGPLRATPWCDGFCRGRFLLFVPMLAIWGARLSVSALSRSLFLQPRVARAHDVIVPRSVCATCLLQRVNVVVAVQKAVLMRFFYFSIFA